MNPAAPGPKDAKPQQLLRALLGDFWHWREEHLPSAALVELLGDFDVTPAGARSALRRLAARGLLTVERNGRTTAYGIPRRSAAVIVEHAYRMLSFGASAPSWDGLWTVVVFSVPERERSLRSELRSRLRVLRFAPLYDGVWVTPHDRVEGVSDALDELGTTTATVLRSTEAGGTERLQRAFDLAPYTRRYREFAEHYEPLLERAEAGRVDPAEALRVRTVVGARWRRFEETDPDLPAELLPADWERDRAYQVFLGIYERLGTLAELRFRQVVGRISPDLAELSARHRLAGITELYESLAEHPSGDTPFERAADARRLRDAENGSPRHSDEHHR
ncbi:PaaX family transcriptional regulator C-terminal domain-containing protein [Nocardiopsis sp. LOL_012]|uniref:PaaX family transcriptional regulator n=1 Tax=Nocardiopsis sp. LOL_012 TaxID=3345409 RepID=UPI003A873B0E